MKKLKPRYGRVWNNMSITDDLTTLKERIELQNTRVIKLEGQEEEYFKYLKEEFKCDTFEEAEAVARKETAEIKKVETKLETKLLKLNELLETND